MAITHPVTPRTDLKIGKIAVLTDFSAPADAALRYAATMARSCGARIALAHAYLPPGAASSAPEMAMVFEALESCRQSFQAKLLDTGRQPWLKDIQCTTILCEGGPADVLKELKDADMIVVGTSGQTGLKKAVLGSTAEMVYQVKVPPESSPLSVKVGVVGLPSRS